MKLFVGKRQDYFFGLFEHENTSLSCLLKLILDVITGKLRYEEVLLFHRLLAAQENFNNAMPEEQSQLELAMLRFGMTYQAKYQTS